MVNLATHGEALIKVIFDDTDVFLLLIHHYFHIDLKCAVLMEGTAANRVICNTRDQNTKHIVTYLLAAHALTGSYCLHVGHRQSCSYQGTPKRETL